MICDLPPKMLSPEKTIRVERTITWFRGIAKDTGFLHYPMLEDEDEDSTWEGDGSFQGDETVARLARLLAA